MAFDPKPQERIKSPCIGICTLDDAGEVCLGCRRTLHEITQWSLMTVEQKTAVLIRIDRRKP